MRNPLQLERATRRLESLLMGGTSPEAALARCEAGAALPADAGLLQGAAATLVRAQRTDGSWGGVSVTAEALLALVELASAGDPGPLRSGSERATTLAAAGAHAGAADSVPRVAAERALEWLRGRRDGVGRYGEGCDAVRHGQGLCHHFLAGFLAPVPGEDVIATPEDRLTVSVRALRAAFVWGEGAGVHERQLEGVRRVIALWAKPAGRSPVSSPAAVTALDAVLEAPQTPENLTAAAGGLACLVRTQRGDGTWRGVEFFEVLETMLRGVALGYHVPEVDATLERAASWLALSQKADGGWGPGAGPRRLRTAWRVLRHARAAVAGLAVTPCTEPVP